MNVLVTGAAGFIGYHLSRSLLEQDLPVVGFDNLNDYYETSLKEARKEQLNTYAGFRFYKGDLADAATIKDLFSSCHPRIVIHLAAQAGVRYSIDHPEAYIHSNIIGFFNLLEACRQHGVQHLVYASSSSVYGANKKVPFSVDDMADKPVSLYAATKKSNELMAYTYSHLYSIPATGLRFFTVYGPWGRPDMAYYSFTKAILAEQPIKVFNNGDLYRDFTYIDNIITGIVNVMWHHPTPNEDGVCHKLYNIGNNKPVKLLEFIQVLEHCLGKEAIKENYPMQLGDVYQTFADVNELMCDFDFRPETPIEEGLQRFVEWYREYYRLEE